MRAHSCDGAGVAARRQRGGGGFGGVVRVQGNLAAVVGGGGVADAETIAGNDAFLARVVERGDLRGVSRVVILGGCLGGDASRVRGVGRGGEAGGELVSEEVLLVLLEVVRLLRFASRLGVRGIDGVAGAGGVRDVVGVVDVAVGVVRVDGSGGGSAVVVVVVGNAPSTVAEQPGSGGAARGEFAERAFRRDEMRGEVRLREEGGAGSVSRLGSRARGAAIAS